MICHSLPHNSLKTAFGKAKSLNRIFKGSGYKVADGFVVNEMPFLLFLNRHLEQVVEALKSCDYRKLDSIRKTSAGITEILEEEALYGGKVQDELLASFRRLKMPVIVRSCSRLEDSRQRSHAGVFSSCPHVANDQDFLEALKKVYLSAFSPRALMNLPDSNVPWHLMTVLVQEMVLPEVSGICFTRHPDRAGCGYLSWTEGPLGPLVDGRVNPDGICVVNEGAPAPEIGGKDVFGVCKRLEDVFDYPVDVEWGIENGILYIFQVRAVTREPAEYRKQMEDFDFDSQTPVLEGVSVPPRLVPGAAAGRISVQTDPEADFAGGDILVVRDTSPEWEPMMHMAGGLVTDHGCRTSHAAIAAREMGLSAIVGTLDATSRLKTGQKVALHFPDLERGAVFIQGEEGDS
jgi:pyruvate,water dikinase